MLGIGDEGLHTAIFIRIVFYRLSRAVIVHSQIVCYLRRLCESYFKSEKRIKNWIPLNLNLTPTLGSHFRVRSKFKIVSSGRLAEDV
jgi:hypothetical protein